MILLNWTLTLCSSESRNPTLRRRGLMKLCSVMVPLLTGRIVTLTSMLNLSLLYLGKVKLTDPLLLSH